MEKVSTLPIELPLSEIQNFCQRNHINKLYLFGSVLREDFTQESDVDILVEFEQGKIPGLEIVDMQDELSRMIGRVVDLRTEAELSRYFRERVIKQAKLIYGQN